MCSINYGRLYTLKKKRKESEVGGRKEGEKKIKSADRKDTDDKFGKCLSYY